MQPSLRYHYIIGSTIGPHPYPDLVARLQSVISKEIKLQLQEKEGRDYPDLLVACVEEVAMPPAPFMNILTMNM